MKIITFIATCTAASSLLIGCKNTESRPITENTEKTIAQKKEVKTPVKPEIASCKIEGMTCAIGCAKTIETKLAKMDGVQKATIDFDKKQATIEFDATVVTSEKLVQAIETTGDGETYKVSNLKTIPKA